MIIVNTSIVFSNWLSSVEYLLQGLDSIAIYQCYLTGCSSVWFHYLSHEHNWIICKNTCYDQWCIPGTPHDKKRSFADWLWSCDLTQIVWLDRKVEYLGQKVEDSEEKKGKDDTWLPQPSSYLPPSLICCRFLLKISTLKFDCRCWFKLFEAKPFGVEMELSIFWCWIVPWNTMLVLLEPCVKMEFTTLADSSEILRWELHKS